MHVCLCICVCLGVPVRGGVAGRRCRWGWVLAVTQGRGGRARTLKLLLMTRWEIHGLGVGACKSGHAIHTSAIPAVPPFARHTLHRQPFVEEGHDLLRLFPPVEYALLVLNTPLVCTAAVVLGYVGWLMLAA